MTRKSKSPTCPEEVLAPTAAKMRSKKSGSNDANVPPESGVVSARGGAAEGSTSTRGTMSRMQTSNETAKRTSDESVTRQISKKLTTRMTLALSERVSVFNLDDYDTLTARPSARASGVFAITPTASGPNTPSATLRRASLMTKDELRDHAKQRRTRTQQLTLDQHADHGCDTMCRTTVEEPIWCPEAISNSPIYQMACMPAHAHRDLDAGTGTNPSQALARDHLGLPNFFLSGYKLAPDDYEFDPLVTQHLGIRTVTHLRTNGDMLCQCIPKRKMPAIFTKHSVMSALRKVKQCEHMNILHFHEACEDDLMLYIIYENFPCVTLRSILSSQHSWTEEQMANVVRECCSALAFAASKNLYHCGLSLSHVLFPKEAVEDPGLVKVFGIGLIGYVVLHDADIRCWSPEALDYQKKFGDAYAMKMDHKTREVCDSWSLGAISYSIVAQRPPIVGSDDQIRQLIQSAKWSFPAAFDAIDLDAKALIEQLMHKAGEKRMKPQLAFSDSWIRKRWQQPQHGRIVFEHLLAFCENPAPRRLFGRYLVRFLTSEQLHNVSKAFLALDSRGDGMLCHNDLKNAAGQYTNRPKYALAKIVSVMCADELSPISLLRFAESMAEEIMDGPVLRNAFESLDTDGDEVITPEELFQALCDLDFKKTVTAKDVNAYMDEIGRSPEDNSNALSFHEFERMFPIHMEKVEKREGRMQGAQACGCDYTQRLNNVSYEIREWMEHIEETMNEVRHLGKRCLEKKSNQYGIELGEKFKTVADLLANPPGPVGGESMAPIAPPRGRRKNKRLTTKSLAVSAEETVIPTYGVDTFMQERGQEALWWKILQPEMLKLKNATDRAGKLDKYVAHDASQTVVLILSDILEWGRGQLYEYEAFVEALGDLEGMIPTLHVSGRGLPKQQTEAQNNELEREDSNESLEGVRETNHTCSSSGCFVQC